MPRTPSVPCVEARLRLRDALRVYMNGEQSSCYFDDDMWNAIHHGSKAEPADWDLEHVAVDLVWPGYSDFALETIDLNEVGFQPYRRVYAWLHTELDGHLNTPWEPFATEEAWLAHEHLTEDIPTSNPPVVKLPPREEGRPLFRSFRLWRGERAP